MAQLKPGNRVRSAVCDTEVMVIAAPAAEVDVTCGGVSMIQLAADPDGAAPADGAADGTRLAPVDTQKTTTVLSKVVAAEAPSSGQGTPAEVDPNAPRWMRRQAARASGGSKKSRKRKRAGS